MSATVACIFIGVAVLFIIGIKGIASNMGQLAGRSVRD